MEYCRHASAAALTRKYSTTHETLYDPTPRVLAGFGTSTPTCNPAEGPRVLVGGHTGSYFAGWFYVSHSLAVRSAAEVSTSYPKRSGVM